jgi:hypothetical protein
MRLRLLDNWSNSSPREPTAEVEETDTDLIDVAETPEAKTTVVKTINTTVTETVSDIAPQVRPGVTIPEQLDVPQGRLSVVSGNDDVAATDTESSMLIEEENAELDQRIAELEIQLAVQQEEADRAAVERGNLNSRLAVVEAQIVAAEEIIRLRICNWPRCRRAWHRRLRSPLRRQSCKQK